MAEPSPGAAPREALLSWYRPRRRAYPWRRAHPDPYVVLVSEVMLQQTQAARVVPAFESFIARFPTPEDLAAASRGDVVRAWADLGYQRRAVALHAAARIIVRDHGGRVPRAIGALRGLPGVGPYTAAAVASLAFDAPVAAVDTNARRIWARVVHGAESDEISPAALHADAQGWLDDADPAAWNQALMDLGRAVCRPAPRCDECPLRPWCRFASSGRRGRASTRRQAPFIGSRRQVRGAIVAYLRVRSPASLAVLAGATGYDRDRLADAAAGLARDGVVEASEAALGGSPNGLLRLPG